MVRYIVEVSDDGTRTWYNDKGEVHREDGPAIEGRNGDCWWYRNGELHREEGPAIECGNGLYSSWYLNGCQYTEEEFAKASSEYKRTLARTFKNLFGKIFNNEGG
jgi:hypothetical protein